MATTHNMPLIFVKDNIRIHQNVTSKFFRVTQTIKWTSPEQITSYRGTSATKQAQIRYYMTLLMIHSDIPVFIG